MPRLYVEPHTTRKEENKMNRYVLEDRIGQGTFGIVYRATKKGEPECGKVSKKKEIIIR